VAHPQNLRIVFLVPPRGNAGPPKPLAFIAICVGVARG
jgi:hypothetical protein